MKVTSESQSSVVLVSVVSKVIHLSQPLTEFEKIFDIFQVYLST